jgi:hypothetical protein
LYVSSPARFYSGFTVPLHSSLSLYSLRHKKKKKAMPHHHDNSFSPFYAFPLR